MIFFLIILPQQGKGRKRKQTVNFKDYGNHASDENYMNEKIYKR